LAGCGAWACPVCGPRRARSYASAVAYVDPGTFGRFSLMPETFEATRRQMYDLRRRIKDRYEGGCEWAWVRHRNPRGTGFHVHFLARMGFVPQRGLQAMMGGRIPWLAKTRRPEAVSDYALGVRDRGGAAGYLVSKARPEFFAVHLELNNGRALHWSRGFFPGGVGKVLHEVKRERGPQTWYYPGSPNPPDWSKGLDQGAWHEVETPRQPTKGGAECKPTLF